MLYFSTCAILCKVDVCRDLERMNIVKITQKNRDGKKRREGSNNFSCRITENYEKFFILEEISVIMFV